MSIKTTQFIVDLYPASITYFCHMCLITKSEGSDYISQYVGIVNIHSLILASASKAAYQSGDSSERLEAKLAS